MRKQLNLSIRINEELFEKIDHMARKTGVSRSELARVILSDSSAIQIINGSQIATELFKIRQQLEKDGLDEVIRQEIFQSCKILKIEIKKAFEKEGEFCGYFEGN